MMKKLKEILSEIRFRDEHGNILRLSDIRKEYQEDTFLTSPGGKYGKIEEQAPLPAEVKRYMVKFTDSLKNAGLNRMKQAQVLAGVIGALDIDTRELMQLIQRVKRGM